jgi:predicted transcriptional regulator of viral defense system
MTYRNAPKAKRTLYALAVTQGGYFTAKQARQAGYSYSHLAYHLKSGNFSRVSQGLYRLPEIPLSEDDELIRLALWSRDRADAVQSTASHETALALHGLSEVLPSRIHLTVPTSFRKKTPRGCVLHKTQLAPDEVMEREGFHVTTPLRTLLDVASHATVSSEQLRKAVADALERGLLRSSRLEAAAQACPAAAARLLPLRNIKG